MNIRNCITNVKAEGPCGKHFVFLKLFLWMQHAAGGVLGLIAGMFVETILFIVRDSLEEKNMKVKLQTKEKLKPLLSTPTDVMVIPTAQPDTAASGVRQRRSHTEAPG